MGAETDANGEQRETRSDARAAALRAAALLPRSRAWDWVVGGVVVALYAAVQLAFLQGPHPYDPAKYFRAGIQFPTLVADYWTLRIGLLAPVRAAVAAVGPSEAALYAVPLLAGVALAVSVYVTMSLLFRDRALAAAAALVTVLNPSFLLNSSHLFPDTTATATFTAGFLCLVAGALPGSAGPRGRLRAASLVLAGALFGWTYLTREFSPILVPAVLGAGLLLRYPIRGLLVLAAAALGTFCVELVYGLARFGDPFVHARTLLARRDAQIAPHRAQRMEEIQRQLDGPFDTMLVLPRLLLSWQSGWAPIALIALFVVALARFRDRRLWLFGIWIFSFWAALTVVGLSFDRSGGWLLNITNVRYWYPLFPALVMGAFGGLALLVRKYAPARRGCWLTGIAGLLLAASTLVPGLVEYSRCSDRAVWRTVPFARLHELRSWLETPEAERYEILWTDPRTYRLAPVATRATFGGRLWHGRLQRVGPAIGIHERDLQRSLVVFHNTRFVPSRARMRRALRRDWVPVFVSGDGRMAALAHASSGAAAATAAGERWWRPATREIAVTAPRCGRSPYE